MSVKNSELYNLIVELQAKIVEFRDDIDELGKEIRKLEEKAACCMLRSNNVSFGEGPWNITL